MNTFVNNFDTIEKLIFEEGLRIENIHFQPDKDEMAIVLNTKVTLLFAISSFQRLAKAPKEVLSNYELFADGTGVRWETLDEDLSLKGFLQTALRKAVGKAA